jgi:hypothetical protein
MEAAVIMGAVITEATTDDLLGKSAPGLESGGSTAPTRQSEWSPSWDARSFEKMGRS